MSRKVAIPDSALSVQTIILSATTWAVFALLFFLLFSVTAPGESRPEWYGIMTYVLEGVAFLVAGVLCFRNWRSSQIVSGGTVWLAIGLGMFFYFTGNLLMAYWEIGLGKSPDISPGDLFFILTYVSLGWGMLQAVLSRKLNLTLVQWVILAGIAIVGIAIATFFAPSSEAIAATPSRLTSHTTTHLTLNTAQLAQTPPQAPAPAPAKTAPPNPSPVASPAAPKPPAVQPAPAPAVATPTASPASPTPATSAAPADPTADTSSSVTTANPERATSEASEPETSTPAWAIALDNQLAPLADIVSWLYIIGDVILVVMATTLLLAFWGGRFAQSWRCIAAASFSYYVADIWFNYATNYIPNYQTGALPEVFWVFSGCLFAIGAALEYDLSTRRRTARRRA